ncbi:MAG: molecular chaperone DnaK [Acidimicrobiales bacterium]|jgi:molecular chaperone DnaK
MAAVPYALAIDLGTTYTAAAIADDRGVRMVELAHDRAAVRSVVSPSTTSLLVGEEALSVAAATPWKVVREFKRRFGDPTPFIVETGTYKSEQLMARLAEWVVEQASSMEGERPHTLVLTHPATWGEFKLKMLDELARGIGIPNVRLLPEPTAAAIHYHERSRVPDGASIAVYDLGGGTFDAAVLERRADGYIIRGQPRGLDHVGGIDFDEAVFNLVLEGLDGALEKLDPEDLSAQRSVARLREECTRAKVALSFDTRVVLPVLLPGLATEVMVQRSQFEKSISPYIDRTVETMKDALDSAGLTSQALRAVLLVGGSSRLPMVSHALTSALGVNVVIDTHPKHAVAMGAALSNLCRGPGPDGSGEGVSRSRAHPATNHDDRRVGVSGTPQSAPACRSQWPPRWPAHRPT